MVHQAQLPTAPSRRSRTYLRRPTLRIFRRVVAWCDWRMRLTVGFRSVAGTRSWPSRPGLSPAGRCPMTTAAPSTALATIQPAFTDAERLALAGFLAGHRGLTRDAYALDLRQFTAWCRARSLALFAVRRADIECFARDLEAPGRARVTVTRRLCTIAGRRGIHRAGLPAPPIGSPRSGTTWTWTGADPVSPQRSLRAHFRHRSCQLPMPVITSPGRQKPRSVP
jgi:hypothetical protein